jgi:MoxR-like ATPase
MEMSEIKHEQPPWWIYRATNQALPDHAMPAVPARPPWRKPRAPEALYMVGPDDLERHAPPFLPDRDTINMVNAAMYLRRPLLVSGHPGTGKTSLGYAIAHELNLGRVLRWSINSRSTLRDGLYDYDAIGRLQHAALRREQGDRGDRLELGDFITLGPLGTALLPWDRPRVVLIDEIDKSHFDLPNDLLHVLEEGEFEIPELVRAKQAERVVRVGGSDRKVPIPDGRVRVHHFPLVVLTSNGEREFPPAFRRRCLELRVPDPTPALLANILDQHFGGDLPTDCETLRNVFLGRRGEGELATDQLMNAVFLRACKVGDAGEWEGILSRVWHSLRERP